MPTEFVVPGRTASPPPRPRTHGRARGAPRPVGGGAGSHVVPYLNRLSDLLWASPAGRAVDPHQPGGFVTIRFRPVGVALVTPTPRRARRRAPPTTRAWTGPSPVVWASREGREHPAAGRRRPPRGRRGPRRRGRSRHRRGAPGRGRPRQGRAQGRRWRSSSVTPRASTRARPRRWRRASPLASYSYDRFKSEPEPSALATVDVVTPAGAAGAVAEGLARAEQLVEAVAWARDPRQRSRRHPRPGGAGRRRGRHGRARGPRGPHPRP